MKLIATFLLFFFTLHTADGKDFPEFPFVYAVGKAAEEVPPNIVTLSFDIEAFDENPDKSYNTVRNRSQEVLGFLNHLDIPKQAIQSYDINKETVHLEKDSTELNIVGYKVTQKFSIKIKQLSKFNTLINKLLASHNIANFGSEFDVSERIELENKLIEKAIENARKQAEMMAKGSGREIDSTFAVSEHEFYSMGAHFGISDLSRDMFAKRMMAGEDVSITYIPSTITIEKKVNIIFKLKD